MFYLLHLYSYIIKIKEFTQYYEKKKEFPTKKKEFPNKKKEKKKILVFKGISKKKEFPNKKKNFQ